MNHHIPLLKSEYLLSTLIISAVVALLIHFPEVLSLSDPSEQGVLFPQMRSCDVINEVGFTFISLLILFGVNTLIFRFNSSITKVSLLKILLSFLLTWMISNLLGQLFVTLHHHFNIPAIDAMVHHYLHPLRDFIMSCIVTGSCYIIYLIRKQQRILLENQQLRTESVINQYEALKNQLNPHMLFNSLNTLQSLIRETPDKALDYTQELSRVLRYTLQSNEIKGVTLSEEMNSAQAYVFLLKMRYEENLHIEIATEPRFDHFILPPMSVQTLIENAVKHNEISNRKPLTITISTTEKEMLRITNNIQPKRTATAGTGIGLGNLSKRYQLLFGEEIQIYKDNGVFEVLIPLLKPTSSPSSKQTQAPIPISPQVPTSKSSASNSTP